MESIHAAALPIFRSAAQAEVLGALYLGGAVEGLTLTELAAKVGRPLSTVHREVERLTRAGAVVASREGNLRRLRANAEAPYFKDLQGLLLRTIGPIGVLRDRLAGIDGIDEAWTFGSWAARSRGDQGVQPADIDLLVGGAPDLDALYDACAAAERVLGLDVNPTIVDAGALREPSTEFVRTVAGDLAAGRLVEVVPPRPESALA